MIERPIYIELLKKYINAPIVKILAGIRRSGKSTLLEMLRGHLISAGVNSERIVSVRYTSMTFGSSLTAQQMYEGVKSAITDDGKHYLLLDEVQEVDGWERVVNSLFEEENVDIYITGSNSKLMSSEISTYLSGRYVLIPVYTLSFAEYTDFRRDSGRSTRELLGDYIRYGGFPVVALGNYEERTAYQIVEGIYNSVITNDIARRHAITNQDLFNRVVRFIIENVGKTFSANAVVRFLKSEQRPLTVETIYNYISWLEKAFVVYRCQRYDLQGKSVLKTQEKFYIADSALKYCILGYSTMSVASMLENIVYFELRRKGYEVYIGKNDTKEIDFVAMRRDRRVYVQVCRELPERSDREIGNLLELQDHYPKYVVTLDEYAGGNVDGVKVMQLSDFLLCEDY